MNAHRRRSCTVTVAYRLVFSDDCKQPFALTDVAISEDLRMKHRIEPLQIGVVMR